MIANFYTGNLTEVFVLDDHLLVSEAQNLLLSNHATLMEFRSFATGSTFHLVSKFL